MTPRPTPLPHDTPDRPESSKPSPRKPAPAAPATEAGESVVGEEDPGAALETLVTPPVAPAKPPPRG